jgi:hypothetical protein
MLEGIANNAIFVFTSSQSIALDLIRILGVREQHEWRGLQTPWPMQIQIPVMGPEQSVTSRLVVKAKRAASRGYIPSLPTVLRDWFWFDDL